MNLQTGWPLVAAGLVSVIVGTAMVWAARPRDTLHRTAVARRHGRQPVGLGCAVTCTSVATAVIVGLQWVIVSQPGWTVAWAVALGVPAFLAGTTTARLFVAVRTAIDRQRQARAVRRTGRGRG